MIVNYLKRFTLISVLILFGLKGFAQPITVVDGNTSPYTPENLITNVFLGQGVTVTDVQFFGDPLSVGYFDEALPSVGIDRGVVMSSGRVSSLGGGVGIDNPGSTFASYNSNTSLGDADLADILVNLPERDVCKYIISFIPTSDTLEFNFVWASEEYPEYACSSFNDVFGFFISGPEISGPYENGAENIALIPNTNTPVSINSIHPDNGPNCPAVNEQFYVDNLLSSNQPVYDGLTQVFTARAIVTPCEEYTIKLAIADAGDEIFDSGVFLEAKSFGTGTIDVALNTISLNGVVAESCSEGEIVFSLDNAPEEDFTVDLQIFGTATQGIDYASFPNEVIIPAGETSITIPFIAFEDNITEVEEYVALEVQRDFCTLDTFYVYIRDNELPELDLGPDVEICEIEETVLNGELSVTLPDPPSFSNIQNFTIGPVGTTISSELEVFGVLPVELGPNMIQSVCINVDHNWLSDLDIYLQSPDGLFMELVTDVGSNGDDYIQTCFVPGASQDIDYIDPPASGAPYTGEFNPEGVWSDLGYGSTTNGTWTLLVIDDSEGFEGTLLDWTITFEPVYDIFYSWTPTAGLDCSDCPNPVASPDVTTEYYLEVTDSYGCTKYDTILVEVQPALEAPDVSCIVTAPDCIEFSWDPVPGALAYLVSVDNAPFIASNGTTSHLVCGLNLNTEVQIEVIGFDNECGGYSGFSSCTTPNCDGAIPTLDSIGGILCYGDETGLIELEATGFPPFEFTLGSETNTTGDFYDLSAGTYTIDILDGQNCVESYDFVVPSPDSLELTLIEDQQISCFGEANAAFSASVIGGSMPYTYSWSGGTANDAQVTDVGSGLLELAVIDNNGCASNSIIEVEEPQPLNVTSIDDYVGCENDIDGDVSITITGGVAPYVYESILITGGVAPGEYIWNEVKDLDPITQDTIYSAEIDDLPAGTYDVIVTDAFGCQVTGTVNVNLIPFNIDFLSTTASCGDGDDGSLTLSATGGGLFDIYSYQWDSNAGGVTGTTANNLSAGTYNVTVTNIFTGCAEVATGLVESNSDIEIDLISTDPLCWNSSDGMAEVQVTTGVYPYTFDWSDGMSTDSLRNDLPTGVYTVTVTDNDDCEAVALIEFEEQDSIELSFVLTDPSCDGFSDGVLTVNATGGAGNYTYDWGGGNTLPTLSSLSSGTYAVIVTDDNMCSQTAEAVLSNPSAIDLDIISTDTDCFGTANGSIEVVPLDGLIADYTITWDDSQSTFTAENLAAGDYGFTVENAEGCIQTGMGTVAQPDELVLDFDSVDDSCVNSPAGQIIAQVSGGTEPYNYNWDGLSGNTDTQSSLVQGNYSVTITDDNNCEISGSTTIDAPDPLTVEVLPVDTDCFQGQNGSASVNLLTGTAPLTYEWSDASVDPVLSNVSAGSYSVTVTDDNDCSFSTSFDIGQPAQITADFTTTNPNCFDSADGIIEVADVGYGGVSADPADFDFEWLVINQNGPVATGLEGNTYAVVITDDLGCTIEEEVTLVSPSEMIQLILEDTPVSCLDESDGAISISTSNGTAPYSYQWGANSNNQTGNLASNLAAGLHEVTITDANGCLSYASFDLSEPDDFDYSYVADSVSCYGYSDGQATLIVSGANNGYSYDWGVPGGSSASNLAAGVYDVTVTDLVGCSFVAQVEVGGPKEVTSSYFTEDVECNGQNNGLIGMQIDGGTPPYEYTLYPIDDNQADNIFENLYPGIYEVLIEDAKGCSFTHSDIEIYEPAPLLVDLGNDTLLQDISTYVVEAEIQNETPVVEFNWTVEGQAVLESFSSNLANLSDIEGRTFVKLVVVDENGCATEDYINLFLRKELVVMVPTAFTPNNDGNNDLLYVHGSEELRVLSLQVFDRWGGRIFHQEGDFEINDPTLHWDGTFKGKEMQSGTYLWSALIQFQDGRTEYFEGSTLLIR